MHKKCHGSFCFRDKWLQLWKLHMEMQSKWKMDNILENECHIKSVNNVKTGNRFHFSSFLLLLRMNLHIIYYLKLHVSFSGSKFIESFCGVCFFCNIIVNIQTTIYWDSGTCGLRNTVDTIWYACRRLSRRADTQKKWLTISNT